MSVNTESIINRISLAAAAPDYFTGSDGRRFCRRCRQPLETFIPCLPGRRIPCICRCMEEEDRRERMQAAVRSRKSACFTNRRSWELTFENSLMEDSKLGLVKAYADKWPEMRRHGRGLLLTGPVGTGKSHAACCLANYLCEKDIAVRMVTLAEVLNGLQSVPDRNAYIKALAENSALLIIDDFGIERDTNYAAEQVFSLIDCRYKSGKPLVATTNLPLSKLKTETDIRYKRIFDRLTAMCEPILFDGRNMRDLRREENHREMKKSLVGD